MRHQPLERPGRALAQHRDRGDEEHRDEGEEADQRPADLLEAAGSSSKRALEQRQQRRRHHEQQRDRARIVAELSQHPQRRRPGDPRAHARSCSSIKRQEGLVEGPRCRSARRSSPGDSAASSSPVAHQQQLVAAVGLVHHVAGDQQGRAVLGERAEGRPEVAPQDRVETDCRLVEHEQRPARRAAPSRARPSRSGRRRGSPRSGRPARRARRPRSPRRSGRERRRGRARSSARFSRTLRSP